MSIEKRKLKSGYNWRAVVRVTGHPTVCATFSRKQEGEDWERVTKAQIKAGKYRTTKPMLQKSFADLVDRYIEEFVTSQHKSSEDTKRYLAYFKDSIGQYALVYITPELILEERKKLLETPTYRGQERNAATVNRYMSSIGGALRYAWKTLRWIDDNPCASIQKLKEYPKHRRTLNEDEVPRLTEACQQSKNPYLYCLALFALTTGARKGEILALTWKCIDFDRAIAHIKDSKNGRPRRIGLVPPLVEELRRLYECRDVRKPLVFASKTTFGTIDPKKAWKKAMENAKIQDFVLHGLRHYYSTFGGKIGASGQQLRSQLGHSSASMTDHYTHTDVEATRYIGEQIQKQFLQVVSDEHSNTTGS